MVSLKDLTRLDEFRAVERLEGEVWGPIDLVPAPILAVTVKRGAVLVGAWDDERLVGFVYSFPALRQGSSTPSHWSHMLGVHPDYRGSGLGRDLKVAQRDRVLALGLDLIEWTYDPLQALNAQLNFVTLGVVVEEYAENLYGESASPLHGGLPTDRFVCQWWIRRPQVERRLQTIGRPLVAHALAEAPTANQTSIEGAWLECGEVTLGLTAPRLLAEIPLDYTGLLAADPARALRWRLKSREMFAHYLGAGYRVVDFALDRARQRGRYMLTNIRTDVVPTDRGQN